MSTRLLNDLDYRIRNVVFEFIARLSEANIPILIINVLRTPEEQAENIAKGVSWTTNSLHLPQRPDGKSLAIDICPYEEYRLNGSDKLQWDSSNPVWERIGKMGEGLGLRWGGRWKVKDMGHFEYQPLSDKVIKTQTV